MSEYPADCFKRRQWISRFTGSAGTVVVTTDKALLWTDGRYFLQAQQELGPDWTLMRSMVSGGAPEIDQWLASELPRGSRVALDPFCHTVDGYRKLQASLEGAGMSLVSLLGEGNLVDIAWGDERPAAPTAPVRPHALQWSGKSVADKLTAMRAKMSDAHADVLLAATLDEVAWLFNLRGSDVSYNPVFLSYGLVWGDGAALYINPAKVPEAVAQDLQQQGVEVRDYSSLVADVRAKAAGGSIIWMDPGKVSYAVYQAAVEGAGSANRGSRGKGRKRVLSPRGGAAGGANSATPVPPSPARAVVEAASPVVAAKAVKNDAELAGMREAHLRDAVAICEFITWLEKQIASGRTVSEVELDEALTARRAAQPGFIEPSFPTIAGADANGAIIHYRAKRDTARTVGHDSLLLLDSGGQYECGTTDITRTMHMGTPKAQHRRAYTRVLQGHIALDQAVFPEGTPGLLLDTLARLSLWREGLNYLHGTGHGVGAGLNVHEGPQSISSRYHITVPLEAGMVVSNEPGYYEDGAFGVRVENLVVVKEVDTPNRFGGLSYFGFEWLTLVPLQLKLVDPSIMSHAELQWIDRYHEEVWRSVSPRLSPDDEETRLWLRQNTLPLAQQLPQEAAAAPAAAQTPVAVTA